MTNGLILLIDDNAELTSYLKILFRDWGHRSLIADTGEEGLALLDDNDFDLVITDVRMPGMSGEAVLRKIKEDHAHIPVILLTAHGNVESAVRSIQEGAFDYINKPLKADEFKIVFDRALEHSRLRRENEFFRKEVKALGLRSHRLIGRTANMREIEELIQRVARTDSTVLITGETGTGKELAARSIHYLSPRATAPLVACNCAALSSTLLESELFGHEKGAFTGATATRKGRFEEADGGTLFLDEIGETSPEFQAKLLRVLQEGEIERVGGNQKIKVDTRIIASTNRELEREIEKGTFREDLYYRLRVIPIHIPPLRERREDIPLLANTFLDEFNQSFNTEIQGFTDKGMTFLKNHPWKGNVRELRHAVERAVILARDVRLDVKDVSMKSAADQSPLSSIDQRLETFLAEKTSEHLIKILEQTGWRQQAAADILGIGRSTLYRLLKKHRIENPLQVDAEQSS